MDEHNHGGVDGATDHRGVELVNLLAPKDAPKGAPLVYDPDVPGSCRWSDAVAEIILKHEREDAPASLDPAAVELMETMTNQIKTGNARIAELERKLGIVEQILSALGEVEIYKPRM